MTGTHVSGGLPEVEQDRQERLEPGSRRGVRRLEGPLVDDLRGVHGHRARLAQTLARSEGCASQSGRSGVEEHIDITAVDEGVEGRGQDFVLEPEAGKDEHRPILCGERLDKGLVRPGRSILLEDESALERRVGFHRE